MSSRNEKLRSLFIHVPKAAGSSLSSVYWNRGNGHDTVADYDHRGELSEDFWVWAFVRNPFDRIACAYEDCPEIFDDCPTFDQFIDTIWRNRDVLEGMNYARWAGGYRLGLPVGRIHFLPQHLLLRDLKGRLRADFVGRFEKLQEDFARVCRRVAKEPETLPHKNSRKGKQRRRFSPLAELYQSPSTVEKVLEIYQTDFELWEYERKI